ncbi:MAG: acyl-CoA thioesterase [Planctomycetes bacterium]|nr:acyl-CoA thioesterase [Planctomycetota bacterium]
MLKHITEIPVRFNEVDSMAVVWHGHYIRYFEDGRESFGKHFGISYLNFVDEGFMVPLTHISCDFKRSARYGDTLKITTSLHPFEGAKLKFTYQICNQDGILLANGKSEQVFLSLEGQLNLTLPECMNTFYEKHGLSFD